VEQRKASNAKLESSEGKQLSRTSGSPNEDVIPSHTKEAKKEVLYHERKGSLHGTGGSPKSAAEGIKDLSGEKSEGVERKRKKNVSSLREAKGRATSGPEACYRPHLPFHITRRSKKKIMERN